MANAEHLEILKQGVEVWNRWRKENPGVGPDLIRADLQGEDLEGVNLVGAHLFESSFENANLKNAELDEVSFWGVDLSRVNLNGAHLRRAKFEDVYLVDASLIGANLHGARFVNTRLDGARLDAACLDDSCLDEARLDDTRLDSASLIRANLSGARLDGASLVSAVLADARLGASLARANLAGANLRGTRLDGAIFSWTSIGDIDLSKCEGLEGVDHFGPSNISINTLERTAASLAKDTSRLGEVEAFLRSAGLEDHWIDYFRDRIGQPIEFYSCFISYSHINRAFASRIHDHLQVRGIRCWLDQHELKPGDRILDIVNDSIRLHDKIVLCCSKASLESWWVKDEIRKAQERERKEDRDIIIPLMVDRYLLDGWEDGLAADLRSRLAADFTGWERDNAKFEEQFERVVKALRTHDPAQEKASEAKL